MKISRRQAIFPALAGAGAALACHGRIERAIRSSWVFWDRSSRQALPSQSAGWRKWHANPLLGGWHNTCFDVSVIRDEGLFKMWLSSRKYHSIAYATSGNGSAFSAPRIVLSPGPGEVDVNRPSIVKRNGVWQMWFTGRTDRDAIYHASSPDGLRWARTPGPAIRATAAWEGNGVLCPSVLWDESAQLYRMWYSAACSGEEGEPHLIGYAKSADGYTWCKLPDPVFTPSGTGFEREGVAACHVVPHAGWHYMFYIGFHDALGASIGMARSRDGVTQWERHPKNPILAAEDAYWAWDRDAAYKPAALVDGSRWMLWYNGRRGGIETIGLAVHEGRFGFCQLLILRTKFPAGASCGTELSFGK